MMPMRLFWRGALSGAALLALPAVAQPDPDRQRIANDSLLCLDHCDTDFQQCFGPPPRGGPRTPIPREGNGSVNTPPPYEQCLLARDLCVAQCQVSVAEDRQRAAAQRRPR